jgi:serine phosphatase RsbU (regulator of sigma subunit)
VAIVRSRLLESRIQQEKLRSELQAAAKIQKLFWPKIPDFGMGSHVWASTKPAATVGGDVYDVIAMPDESWLFYVADVSGKGLPAALIMAAISGKIRSIAPLAGEANEVLYQINKEINGLTSDEGFFATMVMGKYWPPTGKLQVARAGHLYPIWVSKDGVQKMPALYGIPIGIERGVDYGQAEFALSPGESILLLTDGVTEAENEGGERFGHERLNRYFETANGAPWAKGLLEKITSWRGSAEINDDVTVVEIWRDPVPSSTPPLGDTGARGRKL